MRGALEGKVAVITGGAGGIGFALARRLGCEGARVALLDVAVESLRRCTDELQSADLEVVGIPCDVTSQKACRTAVAEVVHRFGGVDVLCNNAGITQISGFMETRVDVYRRVMDVNFFGAIYMTKAAISSLMKRRGIIAVTSSIAGIAPLLGRTGYSASKHALHGFFETLRTELRPTGVHVLMVCPGFTRTSIQSLAGDGSISSKCRKSRKAEATPESVAEAVYRAIVRRRRQVVLSLPGKIAWLTSRLLPGLYDGFMARQVAGEIDSLCPG